MEEKEVFDSKDEIEMKNKFKRYKKFTEIAQKLAIFLTGVTIALMIVIIFEIFNGGNVANNYEFILEDVNNYVTNSNIISEVLKIISGKNINLYNPKIENVIALIVMVIRILQYFIISLILQNLSKVFGNVEKEGTPFSLENIKRLSKISTLAFFIWILSADITVMNFLFVLVIYAIVYIFKYGYKLQKESDETL